MYVIHNRETGHGLAVSELRGTDHSKQGLEPPVASTLSFSLWSFSGVPMFLYILQVGTCWKAPIYKCVSLRNDKHLFNRVSGIWDQQLDKMSKAKGETLVCVDYHK